MDFTGTIHWLIQQIFWDYLYVLCTVLDLRGKAKQNSNSYLHGFLYSEERKQAIIYKTIITSVVYKEVNAIEKNWVGDKVF